MSVIVGVDDTLDKYTEYLHLCDENEESGLAYMDWLELVTRPD